MNQLASTIKTYHGRKNSQARAANFDSRCRLCTFGESIVLLYEWTPLQVVKLPKSNQAQFDYAYNPGICQRTANALSFILNAERVSLDIGDVPFESPPLASRGIQLAASLFDSACLIKCRYKVFHTTSV